MNSTGWAFFLRSNLQKLKWNKMKMFFKMARKAFLLTLNISQDFTIMFAFQCFKSKKRCACIWNHTQYCGPESSKKCSWPFIDPYSNENMLQWSGFYHNEENLRITFFNKKKNHRFIKSFGLFELLVSGVFVRHGHSSSS